MGNKVFTDSELKAMSPKEFRSLVRRKEWTGPIRGACQGYTIANLAIVPKEVAFDFLLFCQRNPRPCPVIEVTEPGNPHPDVAAGADLRTDLPRYRVYQAGRLIDEPTDIMKYWRDDLVSFLIGCSGSFARPLHAANVYGRFVGTYTSNIRCVPTGRLHGPLVVTCSFFKNGRDAVRAVQITSRMQVAGHGPPVHIGDPAYIGIKDLYKPDIFSPGPVTPQEPDEIPMFWGCGVTPQAVALESKLPLMITHWPSHMFVTDRLTEELDVL